MFIDRELVFLLQTLGDIDEEPDGALTNWLRRVLGSIAVR